MTVVHPSPRTRTGPRRARLRLPHARRHDGSVRAKRARKLAKRARWPWCPGSAAAGGWQRCVGARRTGSWLGTCCGRYIPEKKRKHVVRNFKHFNTVRSSFYIEKEITDELPTMFSAQVQLRTPLLLSSYARDCASLSLPPRSQSVACLVLLPRYPVYTAPAAASRARWAAPRAATCAPTPCSPRASY